MTLLDQLEAALAAAPGWHLQLAPSQLEPLLRIARAAEAWREVDERYEADCTCGTSSEGDHDWPATAAVDQYELRRAQLRAAIDALEKGTP